MAFGVRPSLASVASQQYGQGGQQGRRDMPSEITDHMAVLGHERGQETKDPPQEQWPGRKQRLEMKETNNSSERRTV